MLRYEEHETTLELRWQSTGRLNSSMGSALSRPGQRHQNGAESAALVERLTRQLLRRPRVR